MLLLVGLGNPGSDYAANRHNVGFMAVDSIHRHYSFMSYRNKFHGEVSEGSIADEKVYVLKPGTYMNESGRSVAELMRFYKIATNDVVVFHDELDLAPGDIRLRRGGGFAGHKGLKSIADHIGAEFYRVRIGIGHPGEKDQVTRYVLNDFEKSDLYWLNSLLNALTIHAAILIKGNEALYKSKVMLDVQSLKDNDESE